MARCLPPFGAIKSHVCEADLEHGGAATVSSGGKNLGTADQNIQKLTRYGSYGCLSGDPMVV